MINTGACEAVDRVVAARGWILDLDGCLVRTSTAGGEGGALFPGAAELVDLLRASGRRFVCCTNASQRPPAFYAHELSKIGLELDEDEIVTAGSAGADYIRRHHPSARVLVLGEDGITEPLQRAGLNVVDPGPGEQPDVVFVGAATRYETAGIDAACRAVADGAPLYVTVATRWFHGGQGRSVSISSAIASAIEWATDVRPTVVGKPSPLLADTLLERLRLRGAEVVVVGDSAEIEMQLATDIGAIGVLVLSGATAPNEVESLPRSHRPHVCARDVGHLYELVKTQMTGGL